MHESGAMLYLTEVGGTPYVALLRVPPVKTGNGQWWGTQTVGSDLIHLPVVDLPAVKTAQFDLRPYVKT